MKQVSPEKKHRTPSLWSAHRVRRLVFAYLVLLICLVLPANLSAQEGNIRFDRITIEDGLSQSTIFSILQDRQGFMWFGTQDGLNKFDGYKFTVYKHDPEDPTTISDNFVRAIFEDQDGTLWVGTNGGLNKFEPVPKLSFGINMILTRN